MKRIPLPTFVRELLRDEARAGSVFIWSLGGIGSIAFVAAVLAMVVMR